MNIYVVVEDQFPDGQMIMVCECHDEDMAKLAYLRVWFPVESDADRLAVTWIGVGIRDTPALLWKNFQTQQDIDNSPHIKKLEDGTDQESTE